MERDGDEERIESKWSIGKARSILPSCLTLEKSLLYADFKKTCILRCICWELHTCMQYILNIYIAHSSSLPPSPSPSQPTLPLPSPSPLLLLCSLDPIPAAFMHVDIDHSREQPSSPITLPPLAITNFLAKGGILSAPPHSCWNLELLGLAQISLRWSAAVTSWLPAATACPGSAFPSILCPPALTLFSPLFWNVPSVLVGKGVL